MNISAAESKLEQISVRTIDRNKENPRILFRQQEMDQLLDSMKTYGVQVPISVYKKGRRFVLIDGERRWRCAIKLNMRKIPALIQEEPNRLTNILLMFNIHALREQWDLLTIALKLRETIDLLEEENGRRPTELELSKHTGLTRGVIRRCRLLIKLPEQYKEMILRELQKPKSKQKLTEDFFIEMERALKTVERAMPELLTQKDQVRLVLIQKFKKNIIPNRVHFRDVAKIARAENVQSDPERAKSVLSRLFSQNDFSISDAFEESVSEAYLERDILARINGLIDRLREIDVAYVDDELRTALQSVTHLANELLARRK